MSLLPDWRRTEPGQKPDPKRVVASLPLALLQLDPELVVASVNPAAEQLMGQSYRRLVGKSVAELFEFEEPLILGRLADGEANLFARGVGVRIMGQPVRTFDVMTSPVTWRISRSRIASGSDSARAVTLATTGRRGGAIVILASASCISSAAGCISGQ